MLVSFATSQYKTAGILDGIQKNKSDHYYGRCYRKQDEILAEFLMGLMLSKLQNEFVLAICISHMLIPLPSVSYFLLQMKLMKLLQRLPASVVRRLHRERYKKPCWITPVPTSHRLTDQDVTDFVKSMKQPVLMAMFSKTGSMDAAQALQNLALMRPEQVIPPVLEK